MVELLVQREDVESIEADSAPNADFPVHTTKANPSQDPIQPNVKWINADKLWQEGIQGKGITIAVSDTGVRHTHEVLAQNYRGTSGNETSKMTQA